MRRMTFNLLYYGWWTVILIIVLILEVLPVFLVVMAFSLAVGVPQGPALIIIPISFISMVIVACMIATKLTRRPVVVTDARRSDPGGRPRRYLALPGKHATSTEYFLDLKRFG